MSTLSAGPYNYNMGHVTLNNRIIPRYLDFVALEENVGLEEIKWLVNNILVIIYTKLVKVIISLSTNSIQQPSRPYMYTHDPISYSRCMWVCTLTWLRSWSIELCSQRKKGHICQKAALSRIERRVISLQKNIDRGYPTSRRKTNLHPHRPRECDGLASPIQEPQ